MKLELQEAESRYDLNRASELKYGRIPELERELAEAERLAGSVTREVVREEATEEEDRRGRLEMDGHPRDEIAEESETSCSTSRRCSINVSSDKTMRFASSVMPSFGLEPA